MAERKIYLGTFGPVIFDDTDLIEDEDGDFSGEYYHALTSNKQLIITELATDPDHVARYEDLLNARRASLMGASSDVRVLGDTWETKRPAQRYALLLGGF